MPASSMAISSPCTALLPENEEFEPILVDLSQQALVIEGVVVGVIRDGMPLH